MPFYQKITVNPTTHLFVWKISESVATFLQALVLQKTAQNRLDNMKSESHQKGFLAVRMLLQYAGYSDLDLYYDQFGKPHLIDGTFISISHSFGFSVILLSSRNCGVDLELRRDLIIKIAPKFVTEKFVYQSTADTAALIRKLTVIWGAKEAVFKVRNEEGISFKDHIFVGPFDMEDKTTTAVLHFNHVQHYFEVHFTEIEKYTLVWLWENESQAG